MTTLDLTNNQKQQELFDVVLKEVVSHNTIETKKASGDLPYDHIDLDAYRFIYYGGAIRGGKTFGTLGIFVLLCKMYAGSRWHVIRKSYPDLLRSTIPSMEKLLKGASVRWNRSTSNYYVEFPNESRIYFVSENSKQDPLLESFLGLESNGFLLEQEEELTPKARERAKERAGSWYDVKPHIPPPFIFSTFNPTFGHLKEEVYTPWKFGSLEAPSYFISAKPSDNPFVTAEQWRNWKQLDPKAYATMIEGDWEIEIEGAFAYAYDEKKHLGDGLKVTDGRDLWLSFDFNVDPMTCVVFQTDHRSWFKVLREFRIENSDTYEMCAAINRWLKDEVLVNRLKVTGDASGMNRISGAREHINHFEIIRTELGVLEHDFHVPSANPFITDSRVFVNAVLANLKDFLLDAGTTEYLRKDLLFTLVSAENNGKIGIVKGGMNPYAGVDNSKIGHLLDCLRYGMHVTLADFLKIPRS